MIGPATRVRTDAEARNVAATKAIYAAVPAGDLDTALAHLDPEVRITYYGTDAIPYAGDHHGLAAAGEFFTTVGATVEIVEMQAWTFIVERRAGGLGTSALPPAR